MDTVLWRTITTAQSAFTSVWFTTDVLDIQTRTINASVWSFSLSRETQVVKQTKVESRSRLHVGYVFWGGGIVSGTLNDCRFLFEGNDMSGCTLKWLFQARKWLQYWNVSSLRLEPFSTVKIFEEWAHSTQPHIRRLRSNKSDELGPHMNHSSQMIWPLYNTWWRRRVQLFFTFVLL